MSKKHHFQNLRKLLPVMILFLSMMAGIDLTAQPYGDYTFYSPKNTSKAYLVDLSGNIYHTWTFSSSARTGYSSYLLPGGVVLRTVAKSGNYFTGGPICGQVQKVDWNGNVIWDFVYSTAAYCTHHDIHPMPNGNVLLIAYETRTPAQVIQAGCSQSITMWPDKIVEIEPSGATGGNVVWEWHAWDHLCQNVNPAKDNYVTSIVGHPELLNINYKTQKDWLHMNGLDYNETLDQITFSCHNMNELYVIDHSTTTAEAAGHTGGNSGKGGDLLYRWGNPSAYQASGATNFNVIHDAHWVPADCPKANYLVGFNNMGGPGNKSCIDFISPPYNGYNYSITPGSAFAPASIDWRHTYSGTPSQNEGNSQQLPNGNTLITMSLSGYVYEIDSNQNVVWSKTISGAVTNARRYTACYINTPATPTITGIAGVLHSSASTGNQWFLDGVMISGATGNSLTPLLSGNYQVQVTDLNGCVSPLSAPYNITGVATGEMAPAEKLRIFPNPTPGIITLDGAMVTGSDFEITVFNATGNIILRKQHSKVIDLSASGNGIYFLSLKPGSGETITRKIVVVK